MKTKTTKHTGKHTSKRTPAAPAIADEVTGTEFKLTGDEMCDAIQLMEQTIGILDCLEAFADPNVDATGFTDRGLAERMAQASGGASRLVHQAQAVLINAKEIEPGVHHG